VSQKEGQRAPGNRGRTPNRLVNRLLDYRSGQPLERFLKRLSGFALLIIDELGYIPFSKTGAQLLFRVFSERYERGSVLVTTNLAFRLRLSRLFLCHPESNPL
jgi:DNA replication protein DnaC